MLGKRIIESLRRQDWTMVSIEFVLVVVGVVLAFQINDWGHSRSEAKVRRDAAERLLDESERTIAYIKENIGFMQKVVSDLHFASNKIANRTWEPTDESRMRQGFTRGRYMTAMVPPTSVYEDIVASGAFNSIATEDARSKISAFHSTLAFDERTRQQFLPVLRDYEENPAFTYHLDPLATKPLELTVDFRAMAADPVAQRRNALTANDQGALLRIRTRALSDAVAMCRALAEALNRKCNENRPLPKFG